MLWCEFYTKVSIFMIYEYYKVALCKIFNYFLDSSHLDVHTHTHKCVCVYMCVCIHIHACMWHVQICVQACREALGVVAQELSLLLVRQGPAVSPEDPPVSAVLLSAGLQSHAAMPRFLFWVLQIPLQFLRPAQQVLCCSSPLFHSAARFLCGL